MTIENRFEFFGIPIPGMKREMKPGMKGGLAYHWSFPLDLVGESTITVFDEDTVLINLLGNRDTVTLSRDRINKPKIKSNMIIPGLRSVYRWKPD